MERETIQGYNIPKRELTEEEASRPITLERFNEYHIAVGEDFVDQHDPLIIDHKVMAGWLLHKYPERATTIIECLNSDSWYNSLQGLQSKVYENEGDDYEWEEFYSDLAEVLNLTTIAKKRVNQILIQVAEHYNG
jgi:hypothetical protein